MNQALVLTCVSLQLSLAAYFGATPAGGHFETQAVGVWQVPNSDFPPYGVPYGSDDPMDQFQNYYERALTVWYNAVRMAPIQFRDQWMTQFMRDGSLVQVFDSSLYTATPQAPLHWNLNMNRVARAHAVDRNTCFNPAPGVSPHFSCNSSNPSVRFTNYYGFGLNEILIDWNLLLPVSQLRYWPLYTIAQFICDGGDTLTAQGFRMAQCCNDGGPKAGALFGCAAGEDGHRAVIMTTKGEVGCGIDRSDESCVTVCNSDNTKRGPYINGAYIYDGAHVFHPTNTETYAYWASFYAPNKTFVSANVIVDGTPVPLALQMAPGGEPTRGSYASDWFPVLADSEPCHCYYFEFVTVENGTSRYPAQGAYFTHSLGMCTDNWYAFAQGCTTAAPTVAGVSYSPTPAPIPFTARPTAVPTTVRPTQIPSAEPTSRPTKVPTTPTSEPTTKAPTTVKPTSEPTVPSVTPTMRPTNAPTTVKPTNVPTSKAPTKMPTVPSALPTKTPTSLPTTRPTQSPTAKPTRTPTTVPTARPTTRKPTVAGYTYSPTTLAPTPSPTDAPTTEGAAAVNTDSGAATAGAIAGGIIGAVVAVFVLFAIFWYCRYRIKRTPTGSEQENATEPESPTSMLPGSQDDGDVIALTSSDSGADNRGMLDIPSDDLSYTAVVSPPSDVRSPSAGNQDGYHRVYSPSGSPEPPEEPTYTIHG